LGFRERSVVDQFHCTFLRDQTVSIDLPSYNKHVNAAENRNRESQQNPVPAGCVLPLALPSKRCDNRVGGVQSSMNELTTDHNESEKAAEKVQ
jgi:hypothetical protein